MRTIATIEGEAIVENDDQSVSWYAKMAVDSDGIGNHHGDRTAQDQTTYFPFLDADADKYIVVPPAIRDGVKGAVIGCQARVTNTKNRMTTDAVVADIGPHLKLGEASDDVASAVGLNPSPVDGGTDEHVILYQIWPGQAAVVDGKTYNLEPRS